MLRGVVLTADTKGDKALHSDVGASAIKQNGDDIVKIVIFFTNYPHLPVKSMNDNDTKLSVSHCNCDRL